MSRPLVDGLRRLPAIAIVRHARARTTAQVLERLVSGGITVAEVTTSTPGWRELIASAPDRLAIGAGTVLTTSQVRDAHAAGATFIVTPGFDAEVVAASRDLGLEPVPGVLTPTEVGSAMRAGARWLKLFPAGPLGTDYLRGLLGPFSGATFIPTGGIAIRDIPSWMAAGAAALGLGSDLTGRSAPDDDAELDQLERRAAGVVAAFAGVGG